MSKMIQPEEREAKLSSNMIPKWKIYIITDEETIREESEVQDIFNEIRKHDSEAKNEKELKIRVKTLLDSVARKWVFNRHFMSTLIKSHM
ncbi:MAG: hypothetical protein QXF22_02820 [Thermoplasmata archaeon]